MQRERLWAGETDRLIRELEAEQKADAKTFYRPAPADPHSQANGNDRTKFMVEQMRRLLPRLEQMMRAN